MNYACSASVGNGWCLHCVWLGVKTGVGEAGDDRESVQHAAEADRT